MKLTPNMKVALRGLSMDKFNGLHAKVLGTVGERIVVELADATKIKVKRENISATINDMAVTIVDMHIKCQHPYKYTMKLQKDVLAGWSTHSDRLVICDKKSDMHAFVLGLHLAFANEDEFRFTPDNVWLLIVQGVSQHINSNPQKFKTELNIDFEGKKTITLIRDEYGSDVTENSWHDCFPEFAHKIQDIIGEDNVSMTIQNFTTTSHVDTIAYQIVLMDMVKQFLDYRVETRCGVAKYHIEGNLQDWKSIFDNIQKFRKFGLDEWIDKLQNFVLEIIKAVNGKASYSWFKNFYKYNSGSGSDRITGEILTLFPYVKDFNGEFVWNTRNSVSSDQLPSGVTEVPFVWKYLEEVRHMLFKTRSVVSIQNRCICVHSVAQVHKV